MNITLYKTEDEPNKVDKTFIESKGYVDCTAKGEIDVISPSVLIATTDDLTMYNYAYIGVLGRQYFITNVEATRNGLWLITLKVDVLSTYKDSIRQETAIIDRQENEGNLFINDNDFPVENRKDYFFKEFPNGFSDSYKYYLTVGG